MVAFHIFPFLVFLIAEISPHTGNSEILAPTVEGRNAVILLHDHDEHDEHEHHHDHDEHGECCHHHHDHEAHDEHEHHHHYDEHGVCSCGHHHHHHGHDADEVFVSWGKETVRKFGEDELSAMLSKLDGGEYGIVLRAKGIVPCTDGGWIHFDYTPGEQNIRKGPADYTGRLCVIGSKLVDEKLASLFGVA